MARTAIISPNPASRVWQGPCAPPLQSIRAPRAKSPPPRVGWAAECSPSADRRQAMPVYTVHAPGASGADLRSTDKFAFVRDGFHFWAAVFGPLWLIWHRLWLALIGWIIAIVALELALIRLGVGSGAIFFANVIVAILMGFEAASLQRWTFTWRHWRQLDVVVADDEEAAERRFFDRWAAKQRGIVNDQQAVDRGAPPPPREVPGQSFSRPPPSPGSGILGLFPEPGGPR